VVWGERAFAGGGLGGERVGSRMGGPREVWCYPQGCARLTGGGGVEENRLEEGGRRKSCAQMSGGVKRCVWIIERRLVCAWVPYGVMVNTPGESRISWRRSSLWGGLFVEPGCAKLKVEESAPGGHRSRRECRAGPRTGGGAHTKGVWAHRWKEPVAVPGVWEKSWRRTKRRRKRFVAVRRKDERGRKRERVAAARDR